MKITKAIIPVAGWGTRRLPITKSIEKSMLPVGNRPIIDYVVQDCIKAGIRDIYFVVSEGSQQIRSYYSDNHELNEYLNANGKQAMIASVTPPKDVTFYYFVQDPNGKYGTAVPTSLIVPELEPGESVVVLMGDDFVYNQDESSEVARLLEATPEGGSAMLGVNVPQESVSRYGVIEMDSNDHFVQIVEKPAPEDAPSTLINVSKYVLNYDVLKKIAEYVETEQSGEYYITEPINHYVEDGGSVKVVEARGEYLDGGTVEGWLHANHVVLGQ